jgi:GDP/UDP-N,N'-diacetylbacillosamine 2-epimerase (hydrolysing)
MPRRKIAVITESRADYGIQLPVLKAIQACPELELNLIVTGMHLLKEHGSTYMEINRDGFIVIPDNVIHVRKLLPGCDWLVVLGDRMPMLRAVIEAAELGIPIAHIHGGDVTTGACIDESIRHAITRFAHLHFPSMQSSADRLIKWGEESWRVKVVGALGIFNLQDEIPDYKRNNDEPIVLVIQHPTNPITAYGEMMQTLNACGDSEITFDPIIIYPNSDDGGFSMIGAIEKYGCFTTFKNLPFLQFQSLLKASSVLVGNSSVALHEAPLYGIPVVNIGDREQGRESWGAKHTINVPHDSEKIREAIETRLKQGRYEPIKRKVIDGPGIIVKALVETPINEKLRRKGYV